MINGVPCSENTGCRSEEQQPDPARDDPAEIRSGTLLTRKFSMKTLKKIFWTVLCLALFVFCFLKVQFIFVSPRTLVYHFLGDFYKEPKNSLDAVIIGASQAYDSWAAPVAFSQYGMAVWSFCCPRLPAQALIYFAEEVRKQQPEALLIVNLNIFNNTEVNDININWSTNHLPYSLNRIKMIRGLSAEAGYSTLDQLQFIFPMVSFHSRWPNLSSFYFTNNSNGLKSAMSSKIHFSQSVDISGDYRKDASSGTLDPKKEAILDELLKYFDRNQIKPVFVSVPEALAEKEDFISELNTIENIVREHGYECLDFLDGIEETGVRTDTDFTDPRHMNVHGTLKITKTLARYLSEHYDLSDKRARPEYQSWDSSFKKYSGQIRSYTLSFERDNSSRNYDLPAPRLQKARVEGRSVTISWTASQGADSYEIYRKNAKENNNAWKHIATVNGDTLQYSEDGLGSSQTYTYTVVPVTGEGGSGRYGNYNYAGVTAKTK